MTNFKRTAEAHWKYEEKVEVTAFDSIINEATITAREHGWTVSWSKNAYDITIPEALCLIHSELSEALEAYRDNNFTQFKEELADTFIRLFHLLGDLDISDMVKMIECKMEVNRKRPYKHGRQNI